MTGPFSYMDAFRSMASGFIFTTSLPPLVAEGAYAAVEYLKSSMVERQVMHKQSLTLKHMLTSLDLPLLHSSILYLFMLEML